MKTVKVILGSILGFMALLILALLIVEARSNALRGPLAHWTKQELGRELVIHGDLKLKLLTFTPGFEAMDVTFENATWAEPEPLFEARRTAVEIHLLDLIWGRFHVPSIEVDEGHLHLATSGEGVNNWTLERRESESKPEKKPSTDESPASIPQIDMIKLVDTGVTFKSADEKPMGLRVKNLTAGILPGDGIDIPIDIDRAYTPGAKPDDAIVSDVKVRLHFDGDAMSVRLDARALSLDEVSRTFLKEIKLGRFKGEDLIAGTLFVATELKSQGKTLQQLTSHLDGTVDLALQDGTMDGTVIEILGLDVTEAVGSYFTKNRKVHMDCILVHVPVENGRAKLAPLLIGTSDSNLVGEGTVDLGKQELDLKLNVYPKDLSLGALRTPIILRGTFDKPRIGLEEGPLVARALTAAALAAAVAPAAALVGAIEPGLQGAGTCSKYSASIKSVKGDASH